MIKLLVVVIPLSFLSSISRADYTRTLKYDVTDIEKIKSIRLPVVKTGNVGICACNAGMVLHVSGKILPSKKLSKNYNK